MSGTAEPASLPGGARILVRSAVVMAAAAAAVLAVGTQDARLLRLGVVAALWAALLAAFTTAAARREISRRAAHADQLRAVYQLELQREVVARREHALTVERTLGEQARLSQRREIVQLRAAAIGGNLATSRDLARPGSTDRLAGPEFGDSLAGPELHFGPGCPETPGSYDQGRHGVPSGERPGSHEPGNGGAATAQRTVQDLLAAHGSASTPRRRRTRQDGHHGVTLT